MPHDNPTTRELDPLFSPRSIAVIGASSRRDSIGFSLLHNLVVCEFQGAIFPVNPRATSIHSLKAYPSISAVPDPVDLAVIIVPRDVVMKVVEECLEARVKGLVVITAGFAETGPAGARLELDRRPRLLDASAARARATRQNPPRRRPHDRAQLHGHHQRRSQCIDERDLRADACSSRLHRLRQPVGCPRSGDSQRSGRPRYRIDTVRIHRQQSRRHSQ